MNFLFVWTGVTSYMPDCWRTLQKQPGVRVRIIVVERKQPETAFNVATVLEGLDYRLTSENTCDLGSLLKFAEEFNPDVLFIVGWRSCVSRFFGWSRAFRKDKKVLVFDLPFQWTVKKLVAPIVLGPYLRQFGRCFVPGRKAMEYACWLGFGADRVVTGLFSVAESRAFLAEEQRNGFLFVGRYAKEKRLDLLLAAYRLYRNSVETPWPLTCCGKGDSGKLLAGLEGVTDLGFLQPSEIEKVRSRQSVCILCSDFDPWPLVLAEAAVSGLPIICTDRCGNHSELVRGNGIVCRSGNVSDITAAMIAMHQLSPFALDEMRVRGRELVANYTSITWSVRVIEKFGVSIL